MSYSYLRLLQQRLVDDGSDDGDGDGYYVRTKGGRKARPDDGAAIQRAAQLSRRGQSPQRVASIGRLLFQGPAPAINCLRHSHAFSLKAVNHICEMGIIIVCFCCTIGVFFLMIRSPQLKKERAQSGEFAWNLLMFLFVVTVLAGAFTVRTLIGRWRKVSTEVFTSEV